MQPPESDSDEALGTRPGYVAAYEPTMRLALEVARELAEAAPSGDVPVGAVVLGADGAIIGRGHNLCLATTDPTAHAEVVAIREAASAIDCWRLDDSTLVATLEPCTMCAGAVHAARIRRVVYGARDPRAGAAGSLWDVLRDRRLGPPVEVIGGVLADECAQLLTAFFDQLRASEGSQGRTPSQ
jgi:tRNA(adenine34) deaminase